MEIEKPGSHLDHLLRQTRVHHMHLSSMADVKASMILTMASVVLTLCVPQILKPELRAAALVMMTFCFGAVLLATYSVMPKIAGSGPKNTPPDPSDPHFNVLFFGDFIRMPLEEFADRMETIMNDTSETYAVQIREIYNIGVFLARKKYRFIRLAYICIILGFATSGIVLAASLLLGESTG